MAANLNNYCLNNFPLVKILLFQCEHKASGCSNLLPLLFIVDLQCISSSVIFIHNNCDEIIFLY